MLEITYKPPVFSPLLCGKVGAIFSVVDENRKLSIYYDRNMPINVMA